MVESFRHPSRLQVLTAQELQMHCRQHCDLLLARLCCHADKRGLLYGLLAVRDTISGRIVPTFVDDYPGGLRGAVFLRREDKISIPFLMLWLCVFDVDAETSVSGGAECEFQALQ